MSREQDPEGPKHQLGLRSKACEHQMPFWFCLESWFRFVVSDWTVCRQTYRTHKKSTVLAGWAGLKKKNFHLRSWTGGRLVFTLDCFGHSSSFIIVYFFLFFRVFLSLFHVFFFLFWNNIFFTVFFLQILCFSHF